MPSYTTCCHSHLSLRALFESDGDRTCQSSRLSVNFNTFHPFITPLKPLILNVQPKDMLTFVGRTKGPLGKVLGVPVGSGFRFYRNMQGNLFSRMAVLGTGILIDYHLKTRCC